MPRSLSRGVALLVGVLLVTGVVVGLPGRALAAAPTATFTKTSDWGSGFVANYVISNPGPGAVNGWVLEFDLTPSQAINNAWNGVLSRSEDTYTISNASWNGTIAAGGSVTVGFGGTYSGAWTDPTNCTVNNTSCEGGGGGPDTEPPTVPAGVRVVGTTAASVSLAWSASSDNVGVSGYDVLEGATVVATTSATSATAGGLQPESTHTYRVVAFDAAGNRSEPSAAVTATTDPLGAGGGSFASAPYVMPRDNDPPDLAEVTAVSGQTHFVFAFILARDNSACEPAWDAVLPLSQDAAIRAQVDGVRARGGDVVVSFGGALGTKLGQACPDAASTANAIQQVIDRYDLNAIDLNIEVPEIEQDRAVDNELGAAKILKERNPGLSIFVTMPTTATGVNFHGRRLIEKARDRDVPIDAFTIMPFDLGGDSSMGDNAVSIAEAFHDQLLGIFSGIGDAQAYRMSGLSLMNGRTDIGEFYRQGDFRTVLQYAQSHGLGRLTNWSVNRDRECDPPEPGRTFGTCSSVPQEPWEFTRILASFTA